VNSGLATPTSLETLQQYRAAHAGGPEPRRVWLFHSHVYFDHAVPERVAEARAFMDLIGETYAATGHVELNAFVPFPVGPHPRGSFEVLFTREVFAEYVTWLMFNRPEPMAILIHALTRSIKLDHTHRALWLGTQLDVIVAPLEAADAQILADNRSEETVIERTKKHVVPAGAGQPR